MGLRRCISWLVIFGILFGFLLPSTPISAANEPDFDMVRSLNKSTYVEGEQGRIVYTVNPKGSMQQIQRGAADIVLVMDISTSMKADKLNKATKAMEDFIDSIAAQGKGDKVALVTFGYKVGEQYSLTTDYSFIKRTIKDLKNKTLMDGTNFDDALEKAKQLAQSGSNPNKYVIFVSDGNPNYFTSTQVISRYVNNPNTKRVGSTYYYTNFPSNTPEAYNEAKGQASALAERKITLYTLGMGKSNEIDAQFLSELSAITGGKSYISVIPDDLAQNFDKVSEDIKQTRISNIAITETLPQGVSLAAGSNATVTEDGKVLLRVPDILFEKDKGTPAGFSVWLDVIFNKAGNVVFNNSVVQYTAWNGSNSTKALNQLQASVNAVTVPPDMNVSKEVSKTNIIEQETVNLKYKIQPVGTFVDSTRNPMDVVIVIDRSYSMYQHNKIANAKAAAKEFVNTFRQANLGDQIAVVAFNRQSSVRKELTTDYGSVDTAIDGIIPDNGYSSDSGTNYEVGLRAAKNVLEDSTRSRYIIFLSDGMPNYYIDMEKYYKDIWDWLLGVYSYREVMIYNETVGGRSYLDAKEEVGAIASKEITLHTVGVGTNSEVDMSFMQELAERGGGQAYHSTDSSDLTGIFSSISNSVMQQKISNITITEELPEGVEPDDDQVIRDGNKITIRIPDIVFAKEEGTPSPIEYTVKLKFAGIGSYLLSPASVVNYKSWEGDSTSKNFNTVTVNVQQGDYIITNLQSELNVANSAVSGIRVYWNHLEAEQYPYIQNFVIERSLDGSAYEEIGSVANTVDEFMDMNLEEEGMYTYRIKSIVGSNEWIGGVTNPIFIDKTPPAGLQIVADKTLPTNGAVAITILYPSDAQVMQYRIGNSGEWIQYQGAFPITENNTTIQARCRDEWGNWSGIVSYTVTNIDKTPPAAPEIHASTTDPVNTEVQITIDYPSDAVVKQYRNGEGEWVTYEGSIPITQNTVIEARCQDEAGNWSEISSYTVNNILSLVIEYTRDPDPDQGVWINEDVTIMVTITSGHEINRALWDKISPVEFNSNGATSISLESRVEQGVYIYTGTFVVNENGEYTIYAETKPSTSGQMTAKISFTITNILPDLL